MRLTDKLDSIPREHVVVELDVMLDHAQVSSISWYGQRLVSIEGYEGTVDVNELVAKYHSAMPRFRDGAGDLKARLDYYNLWTKVKTVCKDNRALNDTWVYRFLVPMKERSYLCRGARPAPMEFIISKAKGTKFPSKN